MTCAVCEKEFDVNEDGGIALMMAVCYDHQTSLLNNSYCRECYNTFVKGGLVALSHVSGMDMPGLEDMK